jgi:HlyD family secretion protein
MSVTQTGQPKVRGSRPASVPATAPSPVARMQTSRRRWLVPLLAVAGLVVLGFGLRAVLTNTTKADESMVYYTVRRGTLPIVVTERGNLESQQTEQIICEVENFGGDRSGMTGTQILFIVPNGSSVRKGDLLVELDSAPLQERLDMQFLSLKRAEAEKTQAESKYKNQITQNATNKAEAELAVRLTELDVNSYEDSDGGTYQIELTNIEMEIQKARAAQLICKTDYEAFKVLYDLGYKSKGELSAAKLALLKADADLASQMAKSRQLQVYTHQAEKINRQGKMETAQKNREQVSRNNDSDLAQAKAAMDNADNAHAKESERHERYLTQMGKCKIYSPQDGMVAYSNEEGRWNRSAVVEEGAFVRERQEILSIPNLSRMQVNTAVHESVLDQVKPGLRVTVRVDAFTERTYAGTVKSVAVLPDQGGWLSSDTKVYKTIVTIDEEVTQLKPGMTAVVEIDIEQLENVLTVPIQAIVQRADKNWCYVQVGGRLDKREVTLGKTNDKFVAVQQGLAENDVVVLNPMSLMEEQEAAAAAKKSSAERSKEGKEAAAEAAENGKASAPQESAVPAGPSGGEAQRDAASTGDAAGQVAPRGAAAPGPAVRPDRGGARPLKDQSSGARPAKQPGRQSPQNQNK